MRVSWARRRQGRGRVPEIRWGAHPSGNGHRSHQQAQPHTEQPHKALLHDSDHPLVALALARAPLEVHAALLAIKLVMLKGPSNRCLCLAGSRALPQSHALELRGPSSKAGCCRGPRAADQSRVRRPSTFCHEFGCYSLSRNRVSSISASNERQLRVIPNVLAPCGVHASGGGDLFVTGWYRDESLVYAIPAKLFTSHFCVTAPAPKKFSSLKLLTQKKKEEAGVSYFGEQGYRGRRRRQRRRRRRRRRRRWRRRRRTLRRRRQRRLRRRRRRGGGGADCRGGGGGGREGPRQWRR